MSHSVDAVHQALGLDYNTSRLREHYAQWAEKYDSDVGAMGYCAPRVMANLSHSLLQEREWDLASTVVCDAACGTGLVGIELAERGFTIIDGVDLSDDMATRARSTGSYRQVIGGVDLSTPIDISIIGKADIVLCCGAFTQGHLPAEALVHVLSLGRVGSLAVISTRISYAATQDFAAVCSLLARNSMIELVACYQDVPYLDEERAHYWVIERKA